MFGFHIGASSKIITENTHDQMKTMDQGWEVISAFPPTFWDNPTTSPTDSSNFFASDFEDSTSVSCHDIKGANDVSFRSISSPPSLLTRDSLPFGNQVHSTDEGREFTHLFGTGIINQTPTTSPVRAVSPVATFMDFGSGLNHHQRSLEMLCQPEPLYIDPEQSGWAVVHDPNSIFSSNESFFDFTTSSSPPPTPYAIPSPWPSEIYGWATAADKFSLPSLYSESPPELSSQPASALSLPELTQNNQDNGDWSFLCIEDHCDRSAPGNGFSTKSGSAAHWKKEHATHCEKCSLEFTSPGLLKEHRKKAHTMIICPEDFCSRSNTAKGFKLESQLKSHMKSCHSLISRP
ncbi:hypothetical protein N431DRAFT_456586 [Stipitochalara longipes BDJ]|nr:hypothetical protein N431DRAFT_456586 [Stipitochalara longipes BDJ]